MQTPEWIKQAMTEHNERAKRTEHPRPAPETERSWTYRPTLGQTPGKKGE